MENKDLFEIFIFCGGKCGGSSLSKTFINSHYNTTHLHSLTCKGFTHSNIDVTNKLNTLNIIDYSIKKYKNIYFIDSYRNPIERKMSSFFQNIGLYYSSLDISNVDQMIEFFNDKLLYNLEEYHPINEIMQHYDIPLFSEFNFVNGYNILEKDNKVFIKLRFNDIEKWDKYLTKIFGKIINITNHNLSENKYYKDIYSVFKSKYKVPKKYLDEQLVNDSQFKIYNTKKEQDEYIKKWYDKSY